MAERDRRGEDPAVAGERLGALADPRPAGLDEADDGQAAAAGELEHPEDRVGVTLAERSAEHTPVLRVAGDRASTDGAERPEDTVAVGRPVVRRARADPGAQWVEAVRVAERL